MEGSAPKEIVQPADPVEEMQQKISQELPATGHPVSIKELNPSDESFKSNIETHLRDLGHQFSTTWGETGGAEANYTRTTTGHKGWKIWEKRDQSKLGQKKTA